MCFHDECCGREVKAEEFIVEADCRKGRKKGGDECLDFNMLTIGEHNATRGR